MKTSKENLISIIQATKKSKNVNELVGNMIILSDAFRTNETYKNFAPFLHTYFLVTRSVAEHRGGVGFNFEEPEKIEKLDLYFANLYLEPIYQFIKNKEILSPWKEYIQYCMRKSDTNPILLILLGINAHINSDLTKSIIDTDYRNKKDFDKVNLILQDLTPQVLKLLIQEYHDIQSLGGLLLKQFTQYEVKHIIIKWRKLVWKNRENIENRNIKNWRTILNISTEELAQKLIEIFDNKKDLIRIRSAIQNINSMEVTI